MIHWNLQASQSLSPHQFNRVQHTKRPPELPHPIAVAAHCFTPADGEGTRARGKEKWDQRRRLHNAAACSWSCEQTEMWLQERVSPTRNILHPNTTTQQQQALFDAAEGGEERTEGRTVYSQPMRGNFSKCHSNKMWPIGWVEVWSFQNQEMFFIEGGDQLLSWSYHSDVIIYATDSAIKTFPNCP